MTSGFSESHVEHAGIETLKSLGWNYVHGGDISPEGVAPQRPTFRDAILVKRLEFCVADINPTIPEETRAAAIRKILVAETPNLVEENRLLHRLVTEGVDVEYKEKAVSSAPKSGSSISLIPPPTTGSSPINSP